MKKIFLSAVAIMALGTAAQAQDISYGVKAGVNFANFGGDVDESSSRTGFHVGAVVELPISETFSIQPEVVFSQQGAQVDSSTETNFGGVTTRSTTENEQTLNYINVPVLAKYYVMEGLSLELGPQVGFLVSAKSKFDSTSTSTVGGTSTSSSASGETDNKDGFKSVDFSAVAGVGYELPMGLFFQARYQVGISSVLEDSEGLDSQDISTTNQVLSLSVGFKF
jgi:opacity protein-like surface antigen